MRRTDDPVPSRLPPPDVMARLRSKRRNLHIHLRPGAGNVYTSQDRAVLITGLDGSIREGCDQGLFVHETRLLSRYSYRIDGQVPQSVAASNVEQHSWLGYYLLQAPGIDVPPDHGSGQVPGAAVETLELRVTRVVGGGVHEDLDLTSFARGPTRFVLEIDVDADFADAIEALSGDRQQTGQRTVEWAEAGEGVWELRFCYTAVHGYAHQGQSGQASLRRGVVVRLERCDSPPRWEDGRIRFDVRLEPHAVWHTCVLFVPQGMPEVVPSAPLPVGELALSEKRGLRGNSEYAQTQTPSEREPGVPHASRADASPEPPPILYGCRALQSRDTVFDVRRQRFLRASTTVELPDTSTLAQVVVGALDQARRDLVGLRLYDLDRGEDAWTVAAGLPQYVALFGRDALTTAWQAALLGPELMRGSLIELARWQGEVVDDWRDEQPGRMLHEAHTGPLSILQYRPSARYYGAGTTSAFYAVVVAELWHWTGDRELVAPLLEPALRALRWREERSDLDHDGFYEYRTRSTQGTRHQGWKDSSDAIVDEEGRDVAPPIAPCEEQAYGYAARQLLAEVLWWFDDKALARRMIDETLELRRRFNDVFWMEDLGFYAMGLDAQRRPIRAIGSNAGHCLAAGIVDAARAERTAARLMAPDLFSGWGIRTLSTDNPAFNPYSYHRGSVWPVEQGTFALAFARHGLHGPLERIARAVFEAAGLFDAFRLPEAFSGHARDDDHPFPALYPRACMPQAWSSSALFLILQSMLGLYPYAPLKLLVVDPHLPAWLPEIILRDVRVGKERVSIRFFRTVGDLSDYEVLDLEGTLHIVRQPSPWSHTADGIDRLVDVLSSLVK